MALNHDGWAEIFSDLAIVEHVNQTGFFDITATQIKAISKREPRLMAKIDFREHLPPVMVNEQLAILAIANGTYRIGRFDPFIDIHTVSVVAPKSITFPNNIITLNPHALTNESAVLDAALVSGALRQVFGEEVALTIRGRSRNTPFDLELNDVLFPVSGVQIEVDGGYEGATTINLVEAKIGSRNNINIRQLIYPQLAWAQTIGHRKSVRTFICFYQEPILRFIPIIYENGVCRTDHANELAFILEPEAKLNLGAIPPNGHATLPILNVPFPQADRFETVLAMFSIVVREECISKDSLLLDFDIAPRQIDYYSNAMRWLGLIEVNDGIICVSSEGRAIAALTHAEKMQRLAQIIFSEPIFNYVLHNKTNDVPPLLWERWSCSGSTIGRRLSTVRAWVSYFASLSCGKYVLSV